MVDIPKGTISSYLQFVGNIRDKNERINALRQLCEQQPAAKFILMCMFDPSIKFDLPEGAPPYKVAEHKEMRNLFGEIKRIHLFTVNSNLTRLKKEQLFIQLLEYVMKEEAELLIAMKDKKSPYRLITEEVVRTAAPDLIQG
jgi:hypothetical protein